MVPRRQGRAACRAGQHRVCQCRRSWMPPTPSAGQTTTCGGAHRDPLVAPGAPVLAGGGGSGEPAHVPRPAGIRLGAPRRRRQRPASRSRRRRLARGMRPWSQTGRPVRPQPMPSGRDAGARRVVHRPERDPGRMPGAGHVDLPRPVGEPLRGHRPVAPDERESDGAAQRPAVGRRPHVTRRRRRRAAPVRRGPAAARGPRAAPGRAGGAGVPRSLAASVGLATGEPPGLVEGDREAEPDLHTSSVLSMSWP